MTSLEKYTMGTKRMTDYTNTQKHYSYVHFSSFTNSK